LQDTSAEHPDIQVKVQEVDENMITLKEIPQGASTIEAGPGVNQQPAASIEMFTNMEVEDRPYVFKH
jgi:hypothetical protein